MSINQRRDDVQGINDTSERAMELWQEQIAPLAKTLDNISQLLGSVYDQAQGEARQAIVEVWYQVQEYDAAIQGATVTFDILSTAVDELAHEVQNILDAIQRQDRSHPEVGQLIELTEENAEEGIEFELAEAREDGRRDAENSAYIEASAITFNLVQDNLQTYLHLDWTTSKRLANLLVNGHPGSPTRDYISDETGRIIGEAITMILEERS